MPPSEGGVAGSIPAGTAIKTMLLPGHILPNSKLSPNRSRCFGGGNLVYTCLKRKVSRSLVLSG